MLLFNRAHTGRNCYTQDAIDHPGLNSLVAAFAADYLDSHRDLDIPPSTRTF